MSNVKFVARTLVYAAEGAVLMGIMLPMLLIKPLLSDRFLAWFHPKLETWIDSHNGRFPT